MPGVWCPNRIPNQYFLPIQKDLSSVVLPAIQLKLTYLSPMVDLQCVRKFGFPVENVLFIQVSVWFGRWRSPGVEMFIEDH